MAQGETYDEFVAKFKTDGHQKNTDDCYTPPSIYETVRAYVDEHVRPLDGARIVRPFFPGGDYKSFGYQPGDIVLDNPPFSILTRIVAYYTERNIKFFLFCPTLTTPKASMLQGNTLVITAASVTYENGAQVNTSFVTNIWPDAPAVVICGELYKRLMEVQKGKIKKAPRAAVKRIATFPKHVTSPARLTKFATRGYTFALPREETSFVKKLDCGYDIFGFGYLISDQIAEKLERLVPAEEDKIELSEAELAKVAELSAQHVELS